MNIWWDTFSWAEQFFFIIGFVSTAILIVQFVLNLIGLAGHDTDFGDMHDVGMDVPHDVGLDVPHDVGVDVPHDFDIDAPDLDVHDTGFGIFSIRTILAFLIGFGWAGVIMLRADASLFLSVFVAVMVGSVFMLVVFWLMRAIYGLSESGTIDLRNAAGATGSVYLPIPPQEHGIGQVQVVVQGRLREIPAITDSNQALPTGTRIRVVKVLTDDTVVVRRLEVET